MDACAGVEILVFILTHSRLNHEFNHAGKEKSNKISEFSQFLDYVVYYQKLK